MVIYLSPGQQLLEVQKYEDGGEKTKLFLARLSFLCQDWVFFVRIEFSLSELSFLCQDGYPGLIEKAFPGIPDSVDAAFLWGGNNRIYFFKVWQVFLQHYKTISGQQLLEVWSDLRRFCAKRHLPKG